MKQLNNLVRLIISVLIIFFLINYIGFKDILLNLVSIDPIFFLLVIFITLIGLIIGALNVSILLFPIKKIKFTKVFYYNTLSWSIGLFVPGKIGELSLIPFLKKEGISAGHGAVISMLDKLISLMVLSIFSIFGFLNFFDIVTALKMMVILFSIIIILLFLVISPIGRNLIKKYILGKFSIKFQGFSKLLFYYLKNQKSIITLNFIVTFLKWINNALVVYLLFLVYNQNISFISILLINSILMVTSLIPISISGLGVRESAAVIIYQSLGIEPMITLSTHLIPLIVSYFLAIIMISLSFKKLDFHI